MPNFPTTSCHDLAHASLAYPMTNTEAQGSTCPSYCLWHPRGHTPCTRDFVLAMNRSSSSTVSPDNPCARCEHGVVESVAGAASAKEILRLILSAQTQCVPMHLNSCFLLELRHDLASNAQTMLCRASLLGNCVTDYKRHACCLATKKMNTTYTMHEPHRESCCIY